MKKIFILLMSAMLLFSCEKEIIPVDNDKDTDTIIDVPVDTIIDLPIDTIIDVPVIPTTSKLRDYEMIDVKSNGTFEINNVQYSLNDYLNGNNVFNFKSMSIDTLDADSVPVPMYSKVFFKPFIYGMLNNKINIMVVDFPDDTISPISFFESEYSMGEFIDSSNIVIDSLGDTLIVQTVILSKSHDGSVIHDSVVVKTKAEAMTTVERIENYDLNHDDLTFRKRLLNSWDGDKNYIIDSNRVIVDYGNHVYSFQLEVLRIEANDLFIETIVDDKDTVLFFNIDKYFTIDEQGRWEMSTKSITNCYKAAFEWNYFNNTESHLNDDWNILKE